MISLSLSLSIALILNDLSLSIYLSHTLLSLARALCNRCVPWKSHGNDTSPRKRIKSEVCWCRACANNVAVCRSLWLYTSRIAKPLSAIWRDAYCAHTAPIICITTVNKLRVCLCAFTSPSSTVAKLSLKCFYCVEVDLAGKNNHLQHGRKIQPNKHILYIHQSDCLHI